MCNKEKQMCSPENRKEANRLFWIVKGHLIPEQEPDYVVEGYLESYFKRLWNNESGCMEEYEEGFERAYNERLDRQNQEYLKDINNVAVLGGHYD